MNYKSKGYRNLHYWVEKNLGTPMVCSKCNDTSASRYHWANISGEYKKTIDDWARFCPHCHKLMDWGNKCKNGHIFTESNTYVFPSSGQRRCLICKKQRAFEERRLAGKSVRIMRKSYV